MINLENEVNQTKPSNKNMLVVGGVVVAIVIIAGVLVLMNSGSKPAQNNTLARATVKPSAAPTVTAIASSSPSSGSSPSATGSSVANVKTFTLEGKNFRFTPNKINVKKGDKVKVILKVADAQHNFMVDGLNVQSKTGKSGETVEAEFTADKTGEFEFYCGVGNHREAGMVGTLVVTE